MGRRRNINKKHTRQFSLLPSSTSSLSSFPPSSSHPRYRQPGLQTDSGTFWLSYGRASLAVVWSKVGTASSRPERTCDRKTLGHLVESPFPRVTPITHLLIPSSNRLQTDITATGYTVWINMQCRRKNAMDSSTLPRRSSFQKLRRNGSEHLS